jgi:hypothetical protein
MREKCGSSPPPTITVIHTEYTLKLNICLPCLYYTTDISIHIPTHLEEEETFRTSKVYGNASTSFRQAHPTSHKRTTRFTTPTHPRHRHYPAQYNPNKQSKAKQQSSFPNPESINQSINQSINRSFASPPHLIVPTQT